MLKISKINNVIPVIKNHTGNKAEGSLMTKINTLPADLAKPSTNNLQAYIPSFSAKSNGTSSDRIPSRNVQMRTVKSSLDNKTRAVLTELDKQGILDDTNSNDGSSVLENLYKIATEPRIQGLSNTQIMKDVVTALSNPYSITQKFGDIPDEALNEVEQQTGEKVPDEARNVISSSCVVASMEFNLASRKPAEFARFAEGLSSKNYSVDKKIKMSDIANGTVSAIWTLREFNTDNIIDKNWEDVTINIKPDRNAIVRARVQNSYRDNNERSCVDVLIQSALLNLGSQHTYDALTDVRTGKFNPDKNGLTDFEKNFVEEVVFETPKISVVYQSLDENGYLTGYNCEREETKQHILKSLAAGQNVIIGYTHLDDNNKVDGGHEITIIGYKQDENGNNWFICNDTDDEKDEPVMINEEKLLPLIHHAGITQEALGEDDIIVEPWREILDEVKENL